VEQDLERLGASPQDDPVRLDVGQARVAHRVAYGEGGHPAALGVFQEGPGSAVRQDDHAVQAWLGPGGDPARDRGLGRLRRGLGTGGTEEVPLGDGPDDAGRRPRRLGSRGERALRGPGGGAAGCRRLDGPGRHRDRRRVVEADPEQRGPHDQQSVQDEERAPSHG